MYSRNSRVEPVARSRGHRGHRGHPAQQTQLLRGSRAARSSTPSAMAPSALKQRSFNLFRARIAGGHWEHQGQLLLR